MCSGSVLYMNSIGKYFRGSFEEFSTLDKIELGQV